MTLTDSSSLMRHNLELQDVCKSYGSFVAVDHLSLSVPRGSIFGLLGPNGAGKTTTIRMIMDIIGPDSGRVLFQGKPRAAADLQQIGYLPEERGLYRKMTVLDQLVFLGRLHGLTRSDAAARGQKWLDRLELANRSARKVEELSKGQQQKIQLAGTLIHDPELVILDEPFSGLDPINQSLFKDTLADYKDRGKTILFSTHIMEQAEKLCDRIALISQGKVVLEGELNDIKQRFGDRAYRVRGQGSAAALRDVGGVREVLELEDEVQIHLDDDADPAATLRQAVDAYQIDEFVALDPDLEQIFVRTIGDATQ